MAKGFVAPLASMPCTGAGGRFGAARATHRHQGIDLSRPSGTPIRAIATGTIVLNQWSNGAGWYVIVDHGSFRTTSMHQRVKSFRAVGSRVAAGAVIGYVGSTGDSTGPHLHFELRIEGVGNVDPIPWLRAHGINARRC